MNASLKYFLTMVMCVCVTSRRQISVASGALKELVRPKFYNEGPWTDTAMQNATQFRYDGVMNQLLETFNMH